LLFTIVRYGIAVRPRIGCPPCRQTSSLLCGFIGIYHLPPVSFVMELRSLYCSASCLGKEVFSSRRNPFVLALLEVLLRFVEATHQEPLSVLFYVETLRD